MGSPITILFRRAAKSEKFLAGADNRVGVFFCMVHKSPGGFTRVRYIISEHPLWAIFVIALAVRLFNIAHIGFSGGSFLIEDS